VTRCFLSGTDTCIVAEAPCCCDLLAPDSSENNQKVGARAMLCTTLCKVTCNQTMLVGLRSETAACAGGVRSLVEAGLEWRDVTGCASLFRDAMGDETGNMDANIESTVVQRNVLSGTRSKAVDVGLIALGRLASAGGGRQRIAGCRSWTQSELSDDTDAGIRRPRSSFETRPPTPICVECSDD
jgi:hypothetical protein